MIRIARLPLLRSMAALAALLGATPAFAESPSPSPTYLVKLDSLDPAVAPAQSSFIVEGRLGEPLDLRTTGLDRPLQVLVTRDDAADDDQPIYTISLRDSQGRELSNSHLDGRSTVTYVQQQLMITLRAD